MNSPVLVSTMFVISSGVFPSIQAFFALAVSGVAVITAAVNATAVIFFHIFMLSSCPPCGTDFQVFPCPGFLDIHLQIRCYYHHTHDGHFMSTLFSSKGVKNHKFKEILIFILPFIDYFGHICLIPQEATLSSTIPWAIPGTVIPSLKLVLDSSAPVGTNSTLFQTLSSNIFKI